MDYNILTPSKDDERITFEAVKRIRNYIGQEYKGKELFQQLGIRWLG